MNKEMNGPEIPKFMVEKSDELLQDVSREDSDLSKLDLEFAKLANDHSRDRIIALERMRMRREREHQLRISRKKMMMFGLAATTVTALVASATYVMVREASEYRNCREGSASIYEQMIESNNLPSKFKIDFHSLFLPKDQYNLLYENELGEKVRREDVNIVDFVHDILIDALDNGYSKVEVASALEYAGLANRVAQNLLDVTDEEVVACELERYQLLQEQKEMQTEYLEARSVRK